MGVCCGLGSLVPCACENGLRESTQSLSNAAALLHLSIVDIARGLQGDYGGREVNGGVLCKELRLPVCH